MPCCMFFPYYRMTIIDINKLSYKDHSFSVNYKNYLRTVEEAQGPNAPFAAKICKEAATVNWQSGKRSNALKLIDKAIAKCEANGDKVLLADCLQLKSDFLLETDAQSSLQLRKRSIDLQL